MGEENFLPCLESLVSLSLDAISLGIVIEFITILIKESQK